MSPTCIILLLSSLWSVQAVLLFSETFVLQFTCCIAVPSNIPNRNFALNLCIQSNFNAISNVSQLTPTVIQAKSKDEENFDFNRKTLYSYITRILNTLFVTGEECLKRLICESASSTIDTTHRNSLLEKILLHIVTPSRDPFSINDSEMTKYHKAESKGKLKENCVLEYSKCEFSILDFITRKFML